MRDLHDGAQQRLVHTLVTLKVAQQAIGTDEARAAAFLGEAVEHAERAIAELRELAHGMFKAVLSRGGLRAGVRALAQRSQVPVDVQVTEQRLSATVEATAYFVVAEALTNVAKHAARHAGDGDRGGGGRAARSSRSATTASGVPGSRAQGSAGSRIDSRSTARCELESPSDAGTVVAAEIPLAERRVALLGELVLVGIGLELVLFVGLVLVRILAHRRAGAARLERLDELVALVLVDRRVVTEEDPLRPASSSSSISSRSTWAESSTTRTISVSGWK